MIDYTPTRVMSHLNFLEGDNVAFTYKSIPITASRASEKAIPNTVGRCPMENCFLRLGIQHPFKVHIALLTKLRIRKVSRSL